MDDWTTDRLVYDRSVRHAVLGPGAVGGLLAAALARAGFEVVALLRTESLHRFPGRITVESQVLGSFEVAVPGVDRLDRTVDVLWVTPKATHLASALTLAPPEKVGPGVVIPRMNGVEHMATLRARSANVAAGTMRVAAERTASARISQTSPFIRMDLAAAAAVADDVRATGVDCRTSDDEASLLWQKLVFLAPLALATTVADAPLGAVRRDATYRRMKEEVLVVAEAEGASIDLVALQALQAAAPDTMRSSMQHDVERGLVPEIDAIAGPILRAARRHGIDTPATRTLADQVIARAGLSTKLILIEQS
jgi:2-dehydropantoate 2-reductase